MASDYIQSEIVEGVFNSTYKCLSIPFFFALCNAKTLTKKKEILKHFLIFELSLIYLPSKRSETPT
jgi:hypothetical protein